MGRGTQRGQAANAVQRIEDHVGGTVPKRLLAIVNDLAALVGGQALVGNGGPDDVAEELCELLALVGLSGGGTVMGESGLLGEQG